MVSIKSPFKYLNLIIGGDDNEWIATCGICGEDMYLFNKDNTILDLLKAQESHILESHHLTKDDFLY